MCDSGAVEGEVAVDGLEPLAAQSLGSSFGIVHPTRAQYRQNIGLGQLTTHLKSKSTVGPGNQGNFPRQIKGIQNTHQASSEMRIIDFIALGLVVRASKAP